MPHLNATFCPMGSRSSHTRANVSFTTTTGWLPGTSDGWKYRPRTSRAFLPSSPGKYDHRHHRRWTILHTHSHTLSATCERGEIIARRGSVHIGPNGIGASWRSVEGASAQPIGTPDVQSAEAAGPKRHEAHLLTIVAERRHRLEEWRVQRIDVDGDPPRI